MELVFYRCPKCGNIAVKVKDSTVPMFCCGQPMEKMVANTSDGAGEKHLPYIELNNNIINIKIGEVQHPHTPEHHIEFILLQTNKGHYIHYLDAEAIPQTSFNLQQDEKPINAYAYCNLHSLWKKEI